MFNFFAFGVHTLCVCVGWGRRRRELERCVVA